MMLRLILKWPKIHSTFINKMIRKNIENYCPKICQIFRCWLQCWSQLLGLTLGRTRVLFATCFSEPLGGTPLNRCWPPLGHPWSDVVDFLEDCSSKCAPNFKAIHGTNTTAPSKTQVRIPTNTDHQSKQKPCFTFAVLQSRVSPKPEVLTIIWSVELLKG